MRDLSKWTVAVVGAGTMGKGVAQHFASAGIKTYLYNRTERKLAEAHAEISESVEGMIRLGAIKAFDRAETVMSRLSCTADLKTAVSDADLVIECVSEEISLKRELFRQIDALSPERTFICSDTSALNIYEEIPNCRPDRILITHFFNPSNAMPLVEIVKGKDTPQETVDIIKAFLAFSGKQPIVINRCIPGFVFNRLLTALEREALYIVEQGVATPEDIDLIIRTTFGARFAFEGIFDLLDHVGLDVEAAVVGDLLPELSASVTASRVLVEKAEAGDYGVKTEKGFKDYRGQDINQIKKERAEKIVKVLRFISSL